MKVTLEKHEQNHVHLHVEVDADQVQKAWEHAYRHLRQRVNIPGFRRGKAPLPLVEKHVGTQALAQEALEHLVPEAYSRAVEEVSIEPVDQPRVEVKAFGKGQPAELHYTVEVRPEVTVGDYLGVAVSVAKDEVTQDEVDQVLENLRNRRAQLQVVEREVRMGDVVVADFLGKVEGVPFSGGEASKTPVEVAEGRYIPGFVEALVGMKAGETKVADVAFPADYGNAELAGKAATFDLAVHEVKERVLPEVDEDFAKAHGLDSVEQLLGRIREDLERQAAESHEVAQRKEMLEAIVVQSQMELSDNMVRREVYFLLEQHFTNLQRQGADIGKLFNEETRAEWEDRFRAEAVQRIRTSLTLGAIARKEGLEVSSEEVAAAVVEYAQMLGRSPEEFQQELVKNGRYTALVDEVLSNKIIEWLFERAQIAATGSAEVATEGSTEMTAAAEPAKPKKAAKAKAPKVESAEAAEPEESGTAESGTAE
ncbi:MAG: trigger factor [Candidatus Sericytochromatia bacterium]|nr:trigger factor [Candidatus Sericytochromatia bacterium]